MYKPRSPRRDIIPEIAEEIAEELNIDLTKIPLKEIEFAINSEFKFVKKQIKDGKYKNVRYPFLGTFGSMPKRIAKMKEQQRQKRSDLKKRKSDDANK